MTPKILFSHYAFGKNLDAIRTHAASRHYAGVEWNLEQWRVMVARERRRKLFEQFRGAAALCSVHAPYTDWEIGHGDAEFSAASLRILREYVTLAADLDAHHVNIHVGASGL